MAWLTLGDIEAEGRSCWPESRANCDTIGLRLNSIREDIAAAGKGNVSFNTARNHACLMAEKAWCSAEKARGVRLDFEEQAAETESERVRLTSMPTSERAAQAARYVQVATKPAFTLREREARVSLLTRPLASPSLTLFPATRAGSLGKQVAMVAGGVALIGVVILGVKKWL